MKISKAGLKSLLEDILREGVADLKTPAEMASDIVDSLGTVLQTFEQKTPEQSIQKINSALAKMMFHHFREILLDKYIKFEIPDEKCIKKPSITEPLRVSAYLQSVYQLDELEAMQLFFSNATKFAHEAFVYFGRVEYNLREKRIEDSNSLLSSELQC